MAKVAAKIASDVNKPDGLTIVGPEAPLCAGIVNQFQKAGLRIFGPTREAARIEGDKSYAKQLMKRASIPTAEARIFTRFEDAKTYVDSRETGVVVKASGLAAGKGVIVCPDPADALVALERVMVKREFGPAGDTVLVEDFLRGPELSVHALVDDRTIYILESAQDHKAVGDGDTGLNTGGMGAYSPTPFLSGVELAEVGRAILEPWLRGCAPRSGCPPRSSCALQGRAPRRSSDSAASVAAPA